MSRWQLVLLLALVCPAGAPLAQTGSIDGRVVDGESGAPLAGANVVLVGTDRGTATDGSGRFRIEHLPAGQHLLRVSYVGYVTEERSLAVPAGGTVEVVFALEAAIAKDAIVVTADRLRSVGRTRDLPHLIPQSVQVLGEEQLRAQGVSDVASALRNVSGVAVAGREQPFATFSLRGFPADETGTFRRNGIEIPHLADGLRSNVAALEVLKGPASVLYGRLEPGGVVNFVTRQPGCDAGIRNLEMTGGSFALGGVSATLQPACRSSTGIVIDASAERRGSFRDDMDQQSFFASAAVRQQVRSATRVTVDAEYDHSDAALDPGVALRLPTLPERFDRRPFFGEPEAAYRWRSGFASVTAEHRLGEGPLHGVTARAAYGAYLHGREMVSLDSLTAAGMIARSYNADETRYHYLYGEVSTEGSVTTGALRHSFVAGLEATRLAIDVTGEAPLQAIDGGFRFASIAAVSPTAPQASGLPRSGELVQYVAASGSGVNLGLFAQNRSRIWSPAGEVHVVLSARLAHVTAGAEWFALAATADTPAGLNDREVALTALTPAAAVLLAPAPGVSIYGSYGTSFNPIFQQVDSDGQPFEPTTGEQVETGVKFERATWSGSVALFHIVKRGALSRAPGGLYVQTGAQRSRGLELDLSLAPREGLTLLAAYSAIDAQVTADELIPAGNRLAAAPVHSGRLWGSVRLYGDASRGADLGAGLQYVGDRFATLHNDLPLQAYALVDASLTLRAGARMEVQLLGENLLDESYMISAELRGKEANPLIIGWPGTPRNLRVRVLARLP